MHQSDKGRFDAAIIKLLQSITGLRDIPPTMVGGYWSVLRGLPLDDVLRGLTRALNEAAGHISPSELRRLCEPDQDAAEKTRAQRLQSNLDAADQRAEQGGIERFGLALWHHPEFQQIKHVANSAYARHVVGVPPGELGRLQMLDPEQFHTYTGDFDYMAVVNAAPRPKSKRPNDHTRAWEYFWRLLKEEFELYVKNQQVTGPAPEAL